MGRVTDNFYLPNGDVVCGVSLPRHINYKTNGILKVQIIQEALRDFRIRYVPSTDFRESDLELVSQKAREYFGSDARVNLERVHEIERERSGKTRLCISRVSKKDMAEAKAAGLAQWGR
jgi:hypothetical protein